MANDLTTKTVTRNFTYPSKTYIITYESDVYKGEVLDTRVSIDNNYLMTIAGTDIDSFHNSLSLLLRRYRI